MNGWELFGWFVLGVLGFLVACYLLAAVVGWVMLLVASRQEWVYEDEGNEDD